MQCNIKHLIGYSLGAIDGEIGNVEEFYFDDKTWTIRYMIVKTGGWLLGRKVLISQDSLQEPDWEKKEFPVNLTKEQIQSSPYIDTDKPVSRQMEIELYGHYLWQPYWGNGYYGGSGIWNMTNEYPLISAETVKNTDSDEHLNDDQHLRSTHSITDYHLQAIDGDIGHVTDFIMDDVTWQLKYLIINTHNYIGGKKVLIAVENIKEVSWEKSKIIVDISKAAVNNCVLFDESKYNHSKNAKLSSANN